MSDPRTFVKAALKSRVVRLSKRPRRARLAHEPAPGSSPGTLVLEREDPPRIFLMDYSKDAFVEKELSSLDECIPYLTDDCPSITWIDIRGIGHKPTFERLGEIFRLHPLALEDVVNVPQRPKSDTYPSHQLILARTVELVDEHLRTEQIGLLFGDQFLVTVQEEPERDVFEPVRERIRRSKGNLRTSGSDYLAYALVDAIVDGFYPVLETIGEQLEDLELDVLDGKKSAEPIHRIKRDLLTLRRAVWPQRDLINSLLREDSPHITQGTRIYLRDTYDHAVQVMDMLETFRELASGLMDLYLSGVSHRMNEIMKVLTIISTIFLPITFIAGVYGMNFSPASSPYNMPELEWRYGYPFALASMLASVVGLLYFYRKRGWL